MSNVTQLYVQWVRSLSLEKIWDAMETCQYESSGCIASEQALCLNRGSSITDCPLRREFTRMCNIDTERLAKWTNTNG